MSRMQLLAASSVFLSLFLPQTQAFSLGDAIPDVVKVDSLNLAIRIHPKVFGELHSSMQSEAATKICDNFASNLKAGEGPWGMGLFQKNSECTVSEKGGVAFGPGVWTLRFEAPEPDFLPVALCRPQNVTTAESPEKCDVNLKLRMNAKHADRMLSDPRMARLLAGYILDWAPFQARLTTNIISSTDAKQISLKDEDSAAGPFAFPQTKFNLVPFSLKLESKTGLFNVKIVKSNNLHDVINQGSAWLANTSGRGTQEAAFRKQIAVAVGTLAPAFSKQDLDAKNSQNIVGHGERALAKYRLSGWKKTEFELALRGGGIYSNASSATTIAQQYLGELSVHKGNWLNAWLGGSFLRNNYKATSNITNGGATAEVIESSGNLTAMRATTGFGVRLSSESDQTLAVFPIVGYGSMTWKTLGATSAVYNLVLGDFNESGLIYGGAVEYQSPERWAMNIRSRAEVLKQTSLVSYGLKNEFSLRFPKSLDFILRGMHASTGRLLTFFDVAQLKILGKSSALTNPQEIEIAIIDATLGLGLRFEWL